MKKFFVFIIGTALLAGALFVSCSNGSDSTPIAAADPSGGTPTGTDNGGGQTSNPGGTKTMYTVTFGTNGGSSVQGQSVASGGRAARPASPTKGGYVFWGWYSDSACETLFDFGTPITADIKLYAKWLYGRVVTPQDAVLLDLSTEYGELAIKAVGDFSGVFARLCAAIKSYNDGINLDLSEVTGIRKIPDEAFKDSYYIKSITLPDSLVAIGESAFKTCYRLETINIPDSVTDIGKSAFSGCSLVSVTIPSGVKTISDYAFYGCSFISVTIPNGVTNIGNYAFSYCRSLASITIPNSVTSIGYGAFEYCSRLSNITMPNGVTVGSHAFDLYNGDKITVNYTGTIEQWCAESFAWSLSYDSGEYYTRIQYDLYIDGKKVTNLVIPNEVASIAGNAFRSCDSLTSVTIGSGVTTIGEKAFGDCKNLANIIIGDGMTSIPDGAFQSLQSLSNVTIGNSVKTIGKNAFQYCKKLESITIPASVTLIDENAFKDSGLTSIVFVSPDNWQDEFDQKLSDFSVSKLAERLRKYGVILKKPTD